MDWGHRASKRAGKERRNGLNSLIQLVAWSVWKHRNRCTCDNQSPRRDVLLQEITDVARLWEVAGVRGLCQLLA